MVTPEEEGYDLSRTASWLVCSTCGTQFPTADKQSLTTCFICDDPRQFTPPTGQVFTTLLELRATSRNRWTPFPADDTFTSIVTEPKCGIGQRCVLIKTPLGNVLWDCITLLDDETITTIKSLGGLRAIVISHPHYYSTHVEWARAFQCPVYLAAEDREWTTQMSTHQVFLSETVTELQIDGKPSEVQVIKLGGHFPGSFVALYKGRLLIADTLVSTPSGLASWDADALGTKRERPEGLNSYAFMWSIPNMIPLPPSELERMWNILSKFHFQSTHGAFLETDMMKTEAEMKERVLESMQIQIRNMGYMDHAFLKVTAN